MERAVAWGVCTAVCAGALVIDGVGILFVFLVVNAGAGGDCVSRPL